MSPLDVGRRRRRHARSARNTLLRGSRLLLRIRCLVCILLAILLLALVVGPAVLLDQLHGGVIFGGLFEFLNSLCALLLMLPKTSAKGFDSEVVVCGEGRARYVDTVRVLSA